ncbi:mandelate racemase/muconate lactonizing enzyme family protein [Nesterenkonia ebinurensis]|uniref:mandelate racemase/muconate lactonizing enzyme family protein n=1 Tax=Nesterenkonia ebinurensis TaxID=2608252 RepID=UPI00123CA340|nr:mandelate racemase/muconate lactonizing enzyme family protein [Nesterenkonia ebinurensis]
MTNTIAEVRTRLLTRPMARPWVPDAPQMHVVVVEITDDDDHAGTGFSWTPTIGPQAVQALLDHDIRGFLIGRPAEPGEIWDPLWKHLHEAGGGGITTIAIAGADLALWDLAARRSGKAVSELLGRRHSTLQTYGSGVNLHYSEQQLAEQVRRWVEGGHTAVKIKVGSSELSRDVERVRLTREILGAGRRLMVDANQRWDLQTAERAVHTLAEFGLDWVEEPLRAEDTAGYAELSRRVAHAGPKVPIAAGENLHTLYRFRDIISAGAAQVLQPNLVRVGGITPFLRIAEAVTHADLQLAPHLLPDLTGQIAVTLEDQVWVEDVEDAGLYPLGFLSSPSPVRIGCGRLSVEEAPGLGLEFAL